MKSLISALVIAAASILPVSAGVHDFDPSTVVPAPTRIKARVGQGQCFNTRDRSKVCYVKTSDYNFSIAILDVDYPGNPQAASIDCSTGRWYAYGDIPKSTLNSYLGNFCPTYG